MPAMTSFRDIEKTFGTRLAAKFEEEYRHRGMKASKTAIMRDAIHFYLDIPIRERYRDPMNQPSRGKRRRMRPMDDEGHQQPALDPDAFKNPEDKATS